ncbi:hypothetical protein FKO01_64180 [Mesorhizobium sp. B2-3-3]|nr:hypothetical protein FKO01_64180 [Mesorhizobium sp. B2-3-3]
MSDTYRSWDEREAAAEKTRAEAARIAAETEASRRTAEQAAASIAAKAETDRMAEKVKQARLAKQHKAVEAEVASDKEQRKERRQSERLDKGVDFKRLVTIIFALGLLASLPSLISYFLSLRAEGAPEDAGPALYLLPVPFFLELLALTSVKGTQWAVRKGFARWPFWILTGVLAGFAGYINGSKGAEMYGSIAGTALAATSIAGPVLVELREFIEARTAGDNRTAGQRALDKAAARQKAAEAKKVAKEAKKQDREREDMFPAEFKAYKKILASAPKGTLDRDAAWSEAQVSVRFPNVYDRFRALLSLPGAPRRADALADAWRDVEGGPLGVTADVLDRRLRAQRALEDVMERNEVTPERAAVEHLLADLFPTRSGGDEGPNGASINKGPQGPSKSPGALGGIGKRPSGRAPRTDAMEPLRAEDIEAAKKLRDAVPTEQFSTPAVAKLLGRSKVYARRIRDAVQPEVPQEQK